MKGVKTPRRERTEQRSPWVWMGSFLVSMRKEDLEQTEDGWESNNYNDELLF